jgi:DNA-binding NarL/FixJ family response regulator
MIRVQIADDHELVRLGIRKILETASDIQILDADIMAGANLIGRVAQTKADVLLLDLKMPDFNLFETLPQLAALSKPRVIVVTAYHDSHLIQTLTQYGAAGYLLKEEGFTETLAQAIREVARGGMWFSPKAQKMLLEDNHEPDHGLTLYEKQILYLMVQAHNPADIGRQLERSVASIYQAQQKIRDKLGVISNEAAILRAIDEHLVPALDKGLPPAVTH